jgi:predicted small lipoprotein YifL
MRMAPSRILWGTLAAGLLAGCGLKGDLVLPEDAPAAKAEEPAAAPAEAPRVDAPSADEPDDGR